MGRNLVFSPTRYLCYHHTKGIGKCFRIWKYCLPSLYKYLSIICINKVQRTLAMMISKLFQNTWNYVKNAVRKFFGLYSNTIENAWLTELEQKKTLWTEELFGQKNYRTKELSDKRTIGQKIYSYKRINWTKELIFKRINQTKELIRQKN